MDSHSKGKGLMDKHLKKFQESCGLALFSFKRKTFHDKTATLFQRQTLRSSTKFKITFFLSKSQSCNFLRSNLLDEYGRYLTTTVWVGVLIIFLSFIRPMRSYLALESALRFNNDGVLFVKIQMFFSKRKFPSVFSIIKF